MLPEMIFQREKTSVCVGTGLITLDVVMNGHPTRPLGLWAGGSCGNVLAILAFLGWTTLPIARMGNDTSATKLINDLESWGVDTSLIFQNNLVKTPVIVERLTSKADGMVRHSFQWNCPSCGSKLPRYKAIEVGDLTGKVAERISLANVFYFDRVRKSVVELANLNKKNGALIVFEPSGIRDEDLYKECVKAADIVKYSSERISNTEKLHEGIKIPLEIQTLGSQGLRYKYQNENKWFSMPSFKVCELKDPVGSGDWCTAGIIHTLGKDGKLGFSKALRENIELALKFGQALAALNCYYEGARGTMYSLTKQNFYQLLSLILEGNSPAKSICDFDNQHKVLPDPYTCPICDIIT